MRIIIAAGTLLLALLSAAAAPRADIGGAKTISTGNGPQFRAQVDQRLSTSADSVRMMVSVSVPYDNMVFLRTDSGFAAQHELTISIHKDGALLTEHIGSITAVTDSYNETNSRKRNAIQVNEFVVPPGKYRVHVTIMSDRQNRRKSSWEQTIDLELRDPLLRLSDIFWISEDSTLAEIGIARVTEAFATTDSSARSRVQLFSSDTAEILLHWAVIDGRSDTLQSLLQTVQPNQTIQTKEFRVRISELPAQHYVLKLIAEGSGRRLERSREFTVRIPGLPATVPDLELAVRQLKYIASSEENSRLRGAANAAEREARFKEFWKRRDPTPNSDENELMQEYYLRVQFANDKFSTNRPGWESDRGRIYVLHGEPTDVERHPFEAGSRPYEIWFYSNLGRRFVFVDYTGFGDYTLVSPEWGY